MLARYLLLPVLLMAAPALAQDTRFGRWTCTFGSQPFGTLQLSAQGYSFDDKMAGRASGGGLMWEDTVFRFVGGHLTEQGITGGAVYDLPDQPGAQAVDLYTDMGTVSTCTRT